MLHKLGAHHAPKIGGHKVALLEAHILPVLQGRNDGRVGGRTPNAQFFQLAHKACFAETGRRLGELLFLVELFEREGLPCGKGRQLGVGFFLAARHGRQKAGKQQALALGLPLGMRARNSGRSIVKARTGHLRGHKAGPYEPVQVVLLWRQVAFHFIGGDIYINRAYGFMGILRAALGLVNPGPLGQIFLAKAAFNKGLGRVTGFVGNACRVGTHVGDEGGEAPVAQFNAFVEALGNIHGALGRVRKTLVGGLLQGRGDKRRLGRALTLFFFHAFYHKGLASHGVFDVLRLGGIAHHGLFTAHLGKLGLEGRRHIGAQQGLEQPVFFGLEDLAGLLALHNKAQGHRLHAPGRNSPLDGLPQQGRNLVAHQSVQHAARLLRVKKMPVELARIGQRFLDGLGRNFVKLDAFDVLGLVADQFRHMPGNGLSLAVGVGGKVYGVGLGGRSAQFADNILFVVDNLIVRRKIIGLVHAKRAGRQVAHMAHTGLHHVLRPQKLLDGLHLGG